MPQFTPSNSEVFVYVQHEPDTLLARMGHDLKFRVEDFEIDVDLDSETATADFDTDSLVPIDAIIWDSRQETGELSEGDRREIKQRMEKQVLETEEFPNIVLDATSIRETDSGWHANAQLQLHGEEHPIEFDITRQGDRALVETTLDHTDFGIEPYSAMLGGLKVSPTVVVTAEFPIPPGW